MGQPRPRQLRAGASRGRKRARHTWLAVGLVALGLAGCGAGASGASSAGAMSAARRTAPVPSTPAVEVRIEKVIKTVKFRTVNRKDPDLDKGETRVVRNGVDGVLELVLRVTYTDGVRTARELSQKRTVRAPVDLVIAVGTRVPLPAGGDCDQNYSGACVPVDSDVDCEGGSGNGPSYVEGPVRVVGADVYGLDRNGDGVGCE